MALPRKKPSMLRCSGCGTTQEAACDCGVGYLPLGAIAAMALSRSPEKSNGMIAEELGISEITVRRAREKQPRQNDGVERRLGRDGKIRKQPTKPKLRVVEASQIDPAKYWQDRTNALSRQLGWISDFSKQHSEWLDGDPPKEARDTLFHNLNTWAEELLRLASDTLPSIETAR